MDCFELQLGWTGIFLNRFYKITRATVKLRCRLVTAAQRCVKAAVDFLICDEQGGKCRNQQQNAGKDDGVCGVVV